MQFIHVQYVGTVVTTYTHMDMTRINCNPILFINRNVLNGYYDSV